MEQEVVKELQLFRRGARKRRLTPFFSRASTWELLLVIARLDGNGAYGINDYIDQLETLQATRLTIQSFIKDRISEGSLIVIAGNKRSRKTLKLSQELRKELDEYLSEK